jgi:hypothetical protein
MIAGRVAINPGSVKNCELVLENVHVINLKSSDRLSHFAVSPDLFSN